MMKTTLKLFTVCIMLLLSGCDDEQLSFREIYFQVVSNHSQRPQIVVQVISQKGIGESFILSNEIGIGFIPLRIGNYCYKAYDINGQALQLDSEQPSCFSVRKNQLDVQDMIGVVFTDVIEGDPISIGFAHIVAVKTLLSPGETESKHPSVIVRVISQPDKRESFVLSAGAGTGEGIGLVPFRPGNYCFEVYDRKGNALQLDLAHPSCFTILENETTEVKALIQDK